MYSFDLNETDTTRTDGLDLFEIAERGDVDAGLLARLQHGRSFSDLERTFINCKINHFSNSFLKIPITRCGLLRGSHNADSVWLAVWLSLRPKAAQLRQNYSGAVPPE